MRSRELSTRREASGARFSCGFTFVELMVAVGMIAILAAIAIPTYTTHIQTARVASATADIIMISQRITQYNTVNNSFPPDLSAVHADMVLDPWGRPYVYLN